MSEQQLAQSASLLDNSGQQLLPNTRGELVWVKLASSRVVSSYSPEFEPTPSATNGTAHLSWVLARTPRLDLANTFDIFDIKLKSGNSVLPIASMTAEGGLTFGSSDSPIAAIKRYVSSTDKTYVDGNEISMIDASGIHSQRGVSAKGICDLTIFGGGGGQGTVTAVRLAAGSTPIDPDTEGIITLSVYSISQIDSLLEGKADVSRVADIEALIPEDTDTDNPLVNVAGMTEAIQSLPKPMIFKGSLGTGGTITSLPSASKNVEGFTYKVITAGTYSGIEAKVGDTFICAQKTSSTYEWILIPSGDEPSGTVTSVGMAAGTGLVVSRETGQSGPITTSGTFTIGIASGYKLPSAAEWNGKQDTLPTSGDPISTYAINISGNAATLENHGADYFATAAQIELASVALQSLQSQIDSVASRNHFDELIVTSLFADVLVGTLYGNADTATKLATARTITIGNKSNTFDGSENISFTLDEIGAKKSQQAVEKTSTSIKTLTKITQNTNGEISATFEDIQSASTAQKGVVQLTSALNNTSETLAATAKAVKTVNDALSTEVTERKANDVNNVKVGGIKTRLSSTPSMVTAVSETDADTALRFGRTNEAHVDIKRGTAIDISATNIYGIQADDDAEFTRRTTCGNKNIAGSTASLQSIKGNTIVWNQLVDENTTEVTLDSDHKYYTHIGQTEEGVTTYTDSIVTGAGSAIAVSEGDMVFDLTKMTIASAISTPADFKSLFPNSYYSYNAGQLLSLTAQKFVTDGFNQWDEEWENGYYSQGVKQANSAYIRSVNKIKVFPNVGYYITFGSLDTTDGSVQELDIDGKYIKSNSIIGGTKYHAEFTTDSRTAYLVFYCKQTSYNHDININLSWSGIRNGEYEPYWKSEKVLDLTTIKGKLNGQGQSVVIFPDGMRSAGSIHDELVRDASGNIVKAVKRLEKVDMGTLNWFSHTSYGNTYFRSSAISTAKLDMGLNVISPKYIVRTFQVSNIPDGIMSGEAQHGYREVNVRDTSYSDAAAFKAAMSGVMLYYERTEPLTYVLDEPLDPNYRVDDFGTESITPLTDTDGEPITAPFKASIHYGIDARREIETLPAKYVNKMQKATSSEIGLIGTGYTIPLADENHLEAPLMTDPNGKGYTLSQMGYKANDVVFEPTPNFA